MKPDETQKTAEQAENEAIINELDAVRKHKLTDEELVFGILAIIFAFIFPLAGLITGLIGWQRGHLRPRLRRFQGSWWPWWRP